MKCEHCGFEQASGRFCDQCGRMLTRILGVVPNKEEPQSSQVLKCENCGHEQPSGRFCDACGLMIPVFRPPPKATAAPEEPRRVCGKCGVPSSVRICRTCGSVIPGFPET